MCQLYVSLKKKKTYEIYEPNAVFGPCLDPDLNKPTIKRYFWDNWGNLNVDWILNGILKPSVLIGVIKMLGVYF